MTGETLQNKQILSFLERVSQTEETVLIMDEGAEVTGMETCRFSRRFSPDKIIKKESVYPYYVKIKDLHLDLLHSFAHYDLGLLAYYSANKLNLPLVVTECTPMETPTSYLTKKEAGMTAAALKRLIFHVEKLTASVKHTAVSLEELNDVAEVQKIYADVYEKSCSSYTVKDTNFKNDAVLVTLENPAGSLDILLPIDAYVEYHLSVGSQIEKDVISTLLREENLFQAYQGVLNKLKYRDRTVHEVDDYLKCSWHLTEADRRELLERFKAKGYLDDTQYAYQYSDALKAQKLGPSAIKAKLLKKGIALDTVNEVLREYSAEERLQAAEEYAEKVKKQVKNKSLRQKKSILKTKLLQRGYNMEDSDTVLSNLSFEEDASLEDEVLAKAYAKVLRRYEKKYEGRTLRENILRSLLTQGFSYDKISELLERSEVSEDD